MRERLPTDPPRAIALASVSVLCLLVAGAGAFAVIAQLSNTWTYFFYMEQLFATLTPVVVIVAAIALLASIAVVLRIN